MLSSWSCTLLPVPVKGKWHCRPLGAEKVLLGLNAHPACDGKVACSSAAKRDFYCAKMSVLTVRGSSLLYTSSATTDVGKQKRWSVFCERISGQKSNDCVTDPTRLQNSHHKKGSSFRRSRSFSWWWTIFFFDADDDGGGGREPHQIVQKEEQ